ncbi:venom serine protease [Battus philenor]|uniref:venom serine protease n=1 Tax=Battus philenor TaxID=42288 RepID=UPI0035D12408
MYASPKDHHHDPQPSTMLLGLPTLPIPARGCTDDYKGDVTTASEVPYFVSIKEPVRRYNSNSVLWKNLCGGSIITVNKVLTAAHCFEVYNYHYYKNIHLLRVVAGNIRNYVIHSGAEVTEPDKQWRMVRRTILHDSFNFPNNDIALIFVNNFTFTAYVDYVIPASVEMDYGRRCTAVGFGKIGHDFSDTSSHVLLAAKIDVMSRWLCTYRWDLKMNNFICSDSSLTDVARGDSGGPLVCRGTMDPAERFDRDLLVGVSNLRSPHGGPKFSHSTEP